MQKSQKIKNNYKFFINIIIIVFILDLFKNCFELNIEFYNFIILYIQSD